MDTDLLRLYQKVELPVASVLVQMPIDGIAIDQAACAKYLAAARQQLEELESQLDFGSRNLVSARDTYWFLHDEGVVFPEAIGRGFHIDDDDLKELAEEHGIELAGQILSWRKRTRDMRFLEKGAAAGRVDEGQAQGYIDTFFDTYKGILPYFEVEYERLTGPEVSERVLKNPVMGRIRKFPRRKSDKLMREMKATLLQQVESHLLKVSLVRLSSEIRRRGMDARIVAYIHDSIWVGAPLAEEREVRGIMEQAMTTTMSLSVPLLVDSED